VQVTLTREAVLDLPMYLSSCENSSIVLQVQGVFANALSVSSSQARVFSRTRLQYVCELACLLEFGRQDPHAIAIRLLRWPPPQSGVGSGSCYSAGRVGSSSVGAAVVASCVMGAPATSQPM